MKGYSIHIGVNTVDKNHYGTLRDLRAAVFDAEDMLKLCTEKYGYINKAFLTNKTATSKNVLDAFADANQYCDDGDILFISYSGHGSTIEDIRKGERPDEIYDQTWCLYDRQLIDDEIKYAFSQIKKKIRILVVSDSCHSGTVIRNADQFGKELKEKAIPDLNATLSDYCNKHNLIQKRIPKENSQIIQGKYIDFYNNILEGIPPIKNIDSINATVLLLAACQDDEVTFDGLKNGRFTRSLLYVLDNFTISNPEAITKEINSYYQYPEPKVTHYGTSIDFKTKGNPFLIIPNKTEEKIENDIGNGKNSELFDIIENSPIFKTNTILLSSETNQLNLDVVKALYDGQIKSILSKSKDSFKIELPEHENIWNVIHTISRNSDTYGLDIIAEPAKTSGYQTEDFASKAPGSETDFMEYWPPFTETENVDRNWHLDNEHSQLAIARDFVWAKIKNIPDRKPIRIGHLDTGWDPKHHLLKDNKFIRTDLAKSFVNGEEETNTLAQDYVSGKKEQQGHGTGTLGLIGGGHLTHEGKKFGLLGAAPFAEIIPIRVTDSVVIMDNENVVEGLNYAIEQNCDVITMSLGGKPSKGMAKAINKAYEKGIVVVAAAGNCIVKGIAHLGPKKLVYPAKFDRVIAACGATFSQEPYDFDAQKDNSPLKSFSSRFMQGNWGPKSAMKTAIAAYTPNVPWLSSCSHNTFVQSGGGTSSATPQVASAAALWLAFYQEELKTSGFDGWKKVEAVRSVLFSSANEQYPESKKYYGNGILKAYDALNIGLGEIGPLSISKKAKTSPHGILEALDLLFNRIRTVGKDHYSKKEIESLELELTHLIEDLNIERLNEIATAETVKSLDLELFQKYREQILLQNPSQKLIELIGI